MRKKYNTPHRRHVVKTRMTDEEYADFTGRLAAYEISQSEFIRQAIRKATIRPIVTVSPVNDGLLAALSKLTAEYGKIGGNLNPLLLIPMACSLFGISNDVAMQMVGVGFIIGVIQDSVETALNSAGDVEFAATAEYHQWLKQGKPLPDFLK